MPYKCLYYYLQGATWRNLVASYKTRLKIKKRSERSKHCALAVVRWSQKFSPRRRPPSRGRGNGQNLISWRRSLPLSTNLVWWGSMHAISSYRGNRPTNRQAEWYGILGFNVPLGTYRSFRRRPDRQNRLQYTAPQISMQRNKPTWKLHYFGAVSCLVTAALHKVSIAAHRGSVAMLKRRKFKKKCILKFLKFSQLFAAPCKLCAPSTTGDAGP